MLTEPTLHFFAIAAGILLIHRLAAGDPRTIVITPALRADLVRRYRDQLGRPPTADEIATYMRLWERDEALYREALREGIDRDDPTVRNVLISKMRDRAMLQIPIREPTESELQRYFEQHRNLFEAPLIYEHEYVTFAKSEMGAEQTRARYELKLKAGATPASLGLRSVAATVSRERIEQEFGAETADRIVHLPVGEWRPLETNSLLLLVRMIRIEGGPPEPRVLRERLIAGWKSEIGQQALDRATEAIADRYRFVDAK